MHDSQFHAETLKESHFKHSLGVLTKFFLGGAAVKNQLVLQETWIQSQG